MTNESPLIKSGKLKVEAVLQRLKSELESTYEIEVYRLGNPPGQFGPGSNFYLQTTDGLCIEIIYAVSGIIKVGACHLSADDFFLDFTYVSDDFYVNNNHLKIYPKESNDIFLNKINELLGFLHNENKNIKSSIFDVT